MPNCVSLLQLLHACCHMHVKQQAAVLWLLCFAVLRCASPTCTHVDALGAMPPCRDATCASCAIPLLMARPWPALRPSTPRPCPICSVPAAASVCSCRAAPAVLRPDRGQWVRGPGRQPRGGEHCTVCWLWLSCLPPSCCAASPGHQHSAGPPGCTRYPGPNRWCFPHANVASKLPNLLQVHFDCKYRGLSVVSTRSARTLGGNRTVAEVRRGAMLVAMGDEGLHPALCIIGLVPQLAKGEPLASTCQPCLNQAHCHARHGCRSPLSSSWASL